MLKKYVILVSVITSMFVCGLFTTQKAIASEYYLTTSSSTSFTYDRSWNVSSYIYSDLSTSTPFANGGATYTLTGAKNYCNNLNKRLPFASELVAYRMRVATSGSPSTYPWNANQWIGDTQDTYPQTPVMFTTAGASPNIAYTLAPIASTTNNKINCVSMINSTTTAIATLSDFIISTSSSATSSMNYINGFSYGEIIQGFFLLLLVIAVWFICVILFSKN